MSSKLPPNRFFTFKDGSPESELDEVRLAIFTRPGIAEGVRHAVRWQGRAIARRC